MKKLCWVRAAEQKAVKEGTVLVSAGSSVYHNTPEKRNSYKNNRSLKQTTKKPYKTTAQQKSNLKKSPLGNKTTRI